MLAFNQQMQLEVDLDDQRGCITEISKVRLESAFESGSPKKDKRYEIVMQTRAVK